MSDNKTHVEFVKVNESTAEFTGTVSQKDALVLEDNGWTKTLDNKWQKDGVILTKLEYAKLSRPGSIIHTHNEKVLIDGEYYNNDTLWIESCKINDVYNTNEPIVKQNRTNAKKVGCIDAGEFKLRDLRRMSIGEIIDLMMFSFAKPSGYEVSLDDNGALIIKEKFYTEDEKENAQYEEPRIIYTMSSDGSIYSIVSADKLDPVTHKSYDLTIKDNGNDITVAPSNLYNIEVYNYNDKIYPLPIPNNEIWYTTTNKETTQTTNTTGINSLNSVMELIDNVPDGDHCVMKFDKDVTSIGNCAFYGCSSLTSITIPNSVTSIGYMTFALCPGLTSVTIPNSVTSIGNSAFFGCFSLTSITIPNNMTIIDDNTFDGCRGLTSVTIPESVTRIGSNAFDGCTGLTSVTIPNSVTSIGWRVFMRCTGLTSVTIPESLTSIGAYTFSGCSSLTSITYTGTISQWNAIPKGGDWKYNVPTSCQVQCTDGNINI